MGPSQQLVWEPDYQISFKKAIYHVSVNFVEC